MKALTICEPYATLIASGAKRVENRTWQTSYRGPVYIHAGKSKDWLNLDPTGKFDTQYKIALSSMSFGAVIAIAVMSDCVHIERIGQEHIRKKYPWLEDHKHAEGPWCFIFQSVTCIGPWPWRGSQGLFDIDEEEISRVANKEMGIQEP